MRRLSKEAAKAFCICVHVSSSTSEQQKKYITLLDNCCQLLTDIITSWFQKKGQRKTALIINHITINHISNRSLVPPPPWFLITSIFRKAAIHWEIDTSDKTSFIRSNERNGIRDFVCCSSSPHWITGYQMILNDGNQKTRVFAGFLNNLNYPYFKNKLKKFSFCFFLDALQLCTTFTSSGMPPCRSIKDVSGINPGLKGKPF